jgi:hypothetical protein
LPPRTSGPTSTIRRASPDIAAARCFASEPWRSSDTANLTLNRVRLTDAATNGALLTDGHLTCIGCVIATNALRGIDALTAETITIPRSTISDNINGEYASPMMSSSRSLRISFITTVRLALRRDGQHSAGLGDHAAEGRRRRSACARTLRGAPALLPRPAACRCERRGPGTRSLHVPHAGHTSTDGQPSLHQR